MNAYDQPAATVDFPSQKRSMAARLHWFVIPLENAMNEFQRLLSELPGMREQFGVEAVDEAFLSFLLLTKELVLEMDGVRCPSTVSAIINRFSSIHSELDQ